MNPLRVRISSDPNAEQRAIISVVTGREGGLIAALIDTVTELDWQVNKFESRPLGRHREERLVVTNGDGLTPSEQRLGTLQRAVAELVAASTGVPVRS